MLETLTHKRVNKELPQEPNAIEDANPEKGASRIAPLRSASDLVGTYQYNCYIASRAHYMLADCMATRGKWLGIPATILTAIMGTAIFASLNSDPQNSYKILAGVIGMIAALLTGVQTFLNYPDRAEKHKTAGAKYSDLRRKIEIFWIKPANQSSISGEMNDEALTALEGLAEELAHLAMSSPWYPDKYRMRAVRELDSGEISHGGKLWTIWPAERIRRLQAHQDETRAEIRPRSAK